MSRVPERKMYWKKKIIYKEASSRVILGRGPRMKISGIVLATKIEPSSLLTPMKTSTSLKKPWRMASLGRSGRNWSP